MKQTIEFDFACGQHVAITPISTVGVVVCQMHDQGVKKYVTQYWADGDKKQSVCFGHELGELRPERNDSGFGIVE